MNIRSRLLLGAVAMGMAATMGQGANAQGIEIVTVTAAKREQNVQDVPISMNVLSQKQLETYNLSDLKDIAAQIPGMVINKGQTIDALYMRGFGTNGGVNPALENTVSLYVDGVYSGRAREYMTPLFDVKRLEVLRGPQGALIGKNTSVGAISMVTNNPTDTFEAGATVGYLVDRSKGVEADAYISGPVTDTLKARLALKIVDKSGWMKNLANGKNDPQYASQAGRLTLEFNPSESVHMVTKYEFAHMEQDGRSVTGFPTTVLRNQIPGFVQNNPGIPGEVGDLDRNNAHHFANLIEFDIGDLQLVSQTGITAFKSRSVAMGRHLPVENVTTDYRDSFSQYMQEFRLVSPEDQTFSWIVGVYADLSTYNINNRFRYLFFPSAAFNGASDFSYRSKWYTFSAYATGTWNITDDFRLIGGVRGTMIEREAQYNRTVGFGTTFPGADPLAIPNRSETEETFDPSITAQYDVTPDIKVYASWSKGSKGGAFQAIRAVTPTRFYLKPEVSTNYEVGAKSNLFDFLTFNVSAFFLKFKNLQVSSYTVLTLGTPAVLISSNAGEAESKGVEVALSADLNDWVEGLSFDFAGSYADARFTDYPNAPCTTAATLAGCAVTPTGTGFNGKGLTVTAVPEWSGTMGLHYTRDVNDWLKVMGDVGADMRSHYWIDGSLYEPTQGRQNGHTKINFRAGIGGADDSWEVSVVGYNIFDVLTTNGKYNFLTVNAYTIDEGRRVTIVGKIKTN